jgi:hypothetical protein
MLKIQEDRGTSASAQNTNVTNSTVLGMNIYIYIYMGQRNNLQRIVLQDKFIL